MKAEKEPNAVPKCPELTEQQAEQVSGGAHLPTCSDCGYTKQICARREKGLCPYGFPSNKPQKET